MNQTEISLSHLSDEEFTNLVNQDVKGLGDPNVSALLAAPENIDRWYNTLCSLKRNVEAQLSANRAEKVRKSAEFGRKGPAGKAEFLAYRVGTESWRQGAVRFKSGVEDKISEAKRLRHSLKDEPSYLNMVIKERDEAFRQLMRLREGIIAHRDSIDQDDDAADERLWALLDE